jgi:plasmid replication initiation protein
MPLAKPYNLALFEDDKFARANETIAFQVKEGRLTVVIRRLFHFLLYCTHNDGIQETYRRPLQEVMAQIGYNSENIDALKDRLREMRQMAIEWNVDDRKETRWGTSGLLSTVEIVIPKTSGWSMVEWTLAPYVRDRVVETFTYTELSLRIHTQLRGNASIGLYEICSRYKNMPTHMTPAKPWQWWWAQINGEPEEALPEKMEYRYFYRDTLKKAVIEVNEIADIEIELKVLKKGKWIDRLQFSVKRKGEALALPNLETESLLVSLTALAMSVRDARKILSEHPLDLIRKTLALVEKRALDASQPGLRSKAAYFKEALRGRYADIETAPRAAPAVASESQETRLDRAKVALQTRRIEEADKAFKALDAEQMLDLEREFKSHTTVPLFKRSRLAHTAMRKALLEWMADKTWGPITEEQILAEEQALRQA